MEEFPIINEISTTSGKFTTSETSIDRGTLPTDKESIEKISGVYDKLWREFHDARFDELLKNAFEFRGIYNNSERLKAWPKSVAVVDVSLFGGIDIEIYYTAEHPFRPPRIIFNPPIEHELISRTTGAWMADIVGEQWSPSFKIRLLLLTILKMFNV